MTGNEPPAASLSPEPMGRKVLDPRVLEDPDFTTAFALARMLRLRPVSGEDSRYAIAEAVCALESIFESGRETLTLGISAEELERLLHGYRQPPLTAADYAWADDFVLRALKLQDRGQSPRMTAERFDEVARLYEFAGLLQRPHPKSKRQPPQVAEGG